LLQVQTRQLIGRESRRRKKFFFSTWASTTCIRSENQV